jgi:hypothetical protein
MTVDRAEDHDDHISFAVFPETKFVVIAFPVSSYSVKKNYRLGSLEC